MHKSGVDKNLSKNLEVGPCSSKDETSKTLVKNENGIIESKITVNGNQDQNYVFRCCGEQFSTQSDFVYHKLWEHADSDD